MNSQISIDIQNFDNFFHSVVNSVIFFFNFVPVINHAKSFKTCQIAIDIYLHFIIDLDKILQKTWTWKIANKTGYYSYSNVILKVLNVFNVNNWGLSFSRKQILSNKIFNGVISWYWYILNLNLERNTTFTPRQNRFK